MNGTDRRLDLFTRANSICPTPEETLLESVKKNQIDNIKTLIEANRNLLAYEYPFPYEKPILLIACSEENITAETIQTLIDLGAGLDGNEEWKPLHLATINPNYQILETIIKNLKPGQINDKIDGNNALHFLIKSPELEENEEAFLRNVEILLRNGLNINDGDGKNISPILWAAKNNMKHIVKVILEKSIAHVDLDSHKLRNKTAREIIKEKSLYNYPLPEQSKLPYDSKERLFVLLKQSKDSDFVDAFNRFKLFVEASSLVNEEDGSGTLLQYCCEKGLLKGVKCLLENGANVNLVSKNKNVPPIELAAENGYFEIFKNLLDQPGLMISPKIICYLIKNLDNPKFDDIDHEKCFKSLLQKLESNKLTLDINGEDSLKNTPIHYALRYADVETTQKLLKLGASLATKNNFGVMPIEDIKPEVLENHLDSCIKFNIKNKNYEKQDFEVIFDYQSIISPKKIRDKFKFEESVDFVDEELLPETEVVSYMSQAPEFRHLLKHPLIVSFLFMKWHRIRWLFYTNLIFYIMFVLSLIIYIFTYYGDFSDNKSSVSSVLSNLSFFFLNVTFLVLILRELFQITVSPSNYFHNFENLIEIILIVLTSLILFIDSPSNDTRKQLSSIAILLAAFELVLMVGQHPKLSTNVVMLKTVSVNFFKLLLWYSLLIIAFALSFNILFAKPEIGDSTNNSTASASDGDDDDVFTGPGKSLFKTIVMLTGEFDAGSINFKTYPVTSKLIFTLFVFMITIILLNLLNGLAVSDTQTIKNDAELVGHIARAQHIKYVESMLLGNILPSNLFKLSQNMFCCLPCDRNSTRTFFKPLARRVCLFAKSDSSQLCVLPNNHGKIYFEFESEVKNVRNGLSCPFSCSDMYLDKETVKRINAIIKRRREIDESDEVSIERLFAEQKNLRSKLDEVLKILSQSKIEFQ